MHCCQAQCRSWHTLRAQQCSHRRAQHIPPATMPNGQKHPGTLFGNPSLKFCRPFHARVPAMKRSAEIQLLIGATVPASARPPNPPAFPTTATTESRILAVAAVLWESNHHVCNQAVGPPTQHWCSRRQQHCGSWTTELLISLSILCHP